MVKWVTILKPALLTHTEAARSQIQPPDSHQRTLSVPSKEGREKL